MKRIFIGIKVEPDQELLRIHSSLKSVLGAERITWTDPSNIHLTLVFLGDTEEDLIKVASIILKQKCTGFGDFIFNIRGAGVFRTYKDPRIIWVGIEQNTKLLHLNNQIVTGLKDAGFKLEDRPFNPHITLGRIKTVNDHEALKQALEIYNGHHIQEINVGEVILFESILKPTGPVYRVDGRFYLA